MIYNILESLQERKFNLSSLVRLINEDNKESSRKEITNIITNIKNDLDDLIKEIK
mgnify:FL=1